MDTIAWSSDMALAGRKTKQTSSKFADPVVRLTAVTDRMHGLLVQRADELTGCTENSPEERELEALTETIEAYERQRWPLGKIPGGKG
jgi:hypothetical protein